MKRTFCFVFAASVSLTLMYLATGSARVAAQQDGGILIAQRNAGEEASNTETAELVEDPDGDQQRAEIPSPARREALKRRAGEKTLRGAQGRAIVLGMHLQETDNQRATVTDVAPSSAAFDAGIRKGDEIVTFDGFRADSYRDWIDGMRRLTRDVPDGKSLPIVINRDGKRLDLRVRVPVAVAGGLPPEDVVATQQPVVPGQPGQTNVIVPGQGNRPVGVGGGDNILIADAFGDEFNNVDGGATESAIAEIFSLNRPLRTPPVGGRTDAAGTAGQNLAATGQRRAGGDAGQRIGLAGFRNDANGLFVMVDVGNLQPGNYVVGIDDPGVLNTNPIDSSSVPPAPNRVRSGQLGPRNPANTPRDPGNRPRVPAPDGARPADSPTGGTGRVQPQSRLESPESKQIQIPRTVLAQVVDSSTAEAGKNPTAGVGTTNTPATDVTQISETLGSTRETPLDPPITQLDDSGTTATQVPRTADARRDPSATTGIGNVPGGTAMTHQIGTLTVDQSGTGRLQQTVEGVQVQDVVGQAIVLYSSSASANTPLPPNLDAAADPNADPRSTPADRARRNTAIPESETTNRKVAAATNGINGQVPVAGGLIRLISDSPSTPASTTNTQEQPATVPLEGGQSIQVETPSVPAPEATQ
jgi:hypothetical protein